MVSSGGLRRIGNGFWSSGLRRRDGNVDEHLPIVARATCVPADGNGERKIVVGRCAGSWRFSDGGGNCGRNERSDSVLFERQLGLAIGGGMFFLLGRRQAVTPT